jgi:hypothetical protein
MNEHNSWMMVEMTRIYQEERLHEAEQYRLAAAAQGEQPQFAVLVGRLLYDVGKHLSGWGVRLEKRSQHAASLSTYPASDC